MYEDYQMITLQDGTELWVATYLPVDDEPVEVVTVEEEDDNE